MNNKHSEILPMRANYANDNEYSNKIKFEFEGQVLKAFPGDSIAAALIAYDIIELRYTSDGESRGIFCGMGVCQECLVEIDGEQNQRACMTKVREGMQIYRQKHHAKPNLKSTKKIKGKSSNDIKVETPDLIVVGGGLGGMSSASVAAECGMDVVILDERVSLGGQFSKQPTPFPASTLVSKTDPQISLGRRLINRIENAKVQD